MSGETKFTAEQEAKRNAAEDMYEALERAGRQLANLLLVAEVPTRFADSFNDCQKQIEAGLAKARGVADHLATNDIQAALIYGSRSPADQVLKYERSSWHMYMPLLETFDHPGNSDQLTGTPLDHIAEIEAQLGGQPEAVLTCGPEVMMNAVGHYFLQNGLLPENIWLALERRMHCGVGECGHCYLGSSYVCTDGPVYNWQQLTQLHSQTTA